MKYPQYYAKLFSKDNGTPAQHFGTDVEAIRFFAEKYGDDLMAIIKDDGEGQVEELLTFSDT